MLRSLKTYQLVVDVVVAAVFFAATGFVMLPQTSGLGWAITVLVSLTMAGALAVRRLSPAFSLAIAWAGAILQMLAGLDPVPSNLAIFAVLYVTAAYGSRIVFWLGFASALVGALVITGYLVLVASFIAGGLTLSTVPTAFILYLAATFALLLSWTTGALVRTAIRAGENRRAQERAELAAATEYERGRIARDMHDVVAHSLAVVIAQADGARYAIAAAGSSADEDGVSRSAGPAVASQALETIGSTARSALADVRLLLTQLRHSESAGPQPGLADLDGLYADVRAAGLDLAVDVDPAPRSEPSAGVQLAVFRILQEALTNALRHGDGSRVDISLAWHPDRVELAVRNRIGSAARSEGGHGLVGMRERAMLAGGTLEASAEGDLFVLQARLPIEGTS